MAKGGRGPIYAVSSILLQAQTNRENETYEDSVLKFVPHREAGVQDELFGLVVSPF